MSKQSTTAAVPVFSCQLRFGGTMLEAAQPRLEQDRAGEITEEHQDHDDPVGSAESCGEECRSPRTPTSTGPEDGATVGDRRQAKSQRRSGEVRPLMVNHLDEHT